MFADKHTLASVDPEIWQAIRDEYRRQEDGQDFVRGLYACAKRGVASGKSLRQVYAMTRKRLDPEYGAFPIYEHCMPFDVSRAYDEARGIKHPRIWTAKRDRAMWRAIA